MTIPLTIGGVLVLLICGGWIAGDVNFAIYPLLGAPLGGFLAGLAVGRELPVFYATAGVTVLCFFLWALALNDLRRPQTGPRSPGPAQLESR